MAKKKPQTSRRRSRPVETKKKTNPMMIYGIIGVVVIIAVAVSVIALNPFRSPPDNTNNDNNVITGNPIAIIDTSKGTIEVELFYDKLPKTCENFIKLVEDGFYDGMIFHRVMDNFMIQAGNTYPDGSTKVSPYGNIEFETDPDVLHTDGAISMASTGAGVGGSAQFFICEGAQPGLDGSYAVFGQTISGFDVISDIADEPHDSSYGAVGGGRPLTDILIEEITIQYE